MRHSLGELGLAWKASQGPLSTSAAHSGSRTAAHIRRPPPTLEGGTPGTTLCSDSQRHIMAARGAPRRAAAALLLSLVLAALTGGAAAAASNVTTIAGTGQATFAGNGSPASAASLQNPAGMTFDSSGNLIFADLYNQRVRKITPGGTISTVAGTGGSGYSGDGGAATAAQLSNPWDVANHCVRKVDAGTLKISTAAGSCTASGYAGDGGLATAARLNGTRGVAICPLTGNLYISDTDNHRVRLLNLATGNISTVAGSGSSGFGGDNGPATSASLKSPGRVACDSSGNLYIADQGNNRIRRVSYQTKIITTIAGSGSSGFSGDGGAATAASLSSQARVAGHLSMERGRAPPTRGKRRSVAVAAVVVDSAGTIIFPDGGNNRVRAVSSGGQISTLVGSGAAGWLDAAPPAAQLSAPQGVALDASGALYIADVTQQGLVRSVYKNGTILKDMPDFSKMPLVYQDVTPNIDFVCQPNNTDCFGPNNMDYVGVTYTGTFHVNVSGNYLLKIWSQDGSGVFLDGQLVLNQMATAGKDSDTAASPPPPAASPPPPEAGGLVVPSGDWQWTDALVAGGAQQYTGAVYDVDCECGWAVALQVGRGPTGAVADVRVKCSGGVTRQYAPQQGDGTALGGVEYAGWPADRANGFQSVHGIMDGTALQQFEVRWGGGQWEGGERRGVPASGVAGSGSVAELACEGDRYIYGVQIEAWTYEGTSTQQIISIKGACVSKAEVPCEGPAAADCAPGYVWGADIGQCEPCPAGTKEANGECVHCPPGTHNEHPGSTTCPDCTPGYYSESEGADYCAKAPVGSIAPAAATDAVTWCEEGYVSNGAGTACVPCPSGYWRAGKAGPSANACLRMPPGWKANANVGASAVSLCPAGSVSTWGDNSANTAWSAGDTSQTSRSPADATTCDACLANSFAAQDGSSQCQTCRAGFAPNDAHTTCDACPALTYKPIDDAGKSCLKCGPGSETGFVSGAQACTQCAPGFVNPAQTASGSTYQYPGIDVTTYLTSPPDASLGVSPTCLPCPKNWYQDEQGGTQCKQCPAGKGTEGPGSSTCDACPLGSYSPSANSPCVLAPAGTYVNASGATATSDCPVGTYASDAGNDACDACPAGTFAPQPKSTACTKCPAGTYSKAGAASCTPCSPGTYSTAGTRQCLPCRPGNFAKNAGQAKCTPAPAGSFAAGAGNRKATPCPKGSFQDKTGKATCIKCATDTYQPLTGKTTCSACCKAGTELGKTCFLWTRGKTGAAVCDATRVKPGR
eukprot:scaffold6.g2783.t1